MSPAIIEQGISFWVGFTLVVVSLASLLHPHNIVQLLRDIGERAASLTPLIGWLSLSFGAFILGFHWRWDGLAMVLTIVGLLSTAKGVLSILAPKAFGATIAAMAQQEEKSLSTQLRISGFITFLFGALILASWYQGL
ncbi:MAG: hypothetical protein OXF19_04475 [Hyphomicrobiales bacterium]|nr:hypothetical protein [Hyphomicrobiales bacterium]